MVKCVTCGGVYEPVLADGLRYFHVCPPLSVAELAAAVQAGKVRLPDDPATGAAETPEIAVTRRTYERANARDENVTRDGLPKSIGAGVQDLGKSPAPIVKVP